MRRLVALAFLVPSVAAVLVAAGGDGDGTYRVDAIFDNTASLIPGQDVKVAGARVGTVTNVVLTRDRKARIQMEVDPGFAPFRSDARCIIRPQSLVGEKFVQCNPGTPRGRELRARDEQAPTVPLARNSAPVDLDVIFSTLKLPYRERLTVIVNELGAGLAGRPQDLSETIRRANPALREVNDVLRILDRDRDTLGRLVTRSDSVLAELASRWREVQRLVERGQRVTEVTAGRRDRLDEAVRRFPPLLAELEPSSRRVSALAREGTFAARRLRQAAPEIRALFADFKPLNDSARPALRKLSSTAKVGRRAVRAARPVGRRLRRATTLLPPVVRVATELVESLRRRGAIEGLLRFVYHGSTATARFDRYSHIAPSYQIAGPCQEYATRPQAGCNARFTAASAASASRAKRGRDRPRKRAPRSRRRGGAGRGPTAPPSEAAPGAGDAPAPPRRPDPLPGLPPALPGDQSIPLLDFLLGP